MNKLLWISYNGQTVEIVASKITLPKLKRFVEVVEVEEVKTRPLSFRVVCDKYIEQIKQKFEGLISYPLFGKTYHSPEKFQEIKAIYDNVCNVDTTELRAKIVEQNKAKDTKKVQDFLNFETGYLKRDFDLLRVNGENIETSQGVRVPKILVKSLYNRLKSNLDVIGQRVENYTVISNQNGIVQIGCHKVKVSENLGLLESL